MNLRRWLARIRLWFARIYLDGCHTLLDTGVEVMAEAHPLAGVMARRTEWDIRQRLTEYPPTREQLDSLAAEELMGRDRLHVYDILSETACVDDE